ncbi:hypothetical protein LC085_00315 [Bacillus tianshenii]|uniref:hypothetical protein n=1 Tax=Sutcliffiella tianshenii TaxID=1463404 RepID=UPI001CD4CD3D|nr:hypothetical protein [Bacillus tianshenii]MCA1318338.1 hypothetical protein [Bacillus tianshenii]
MGKNLLFAGSLVVFFMMGAFRRISFETNHLIWKDQMANMYIYIENYRFGMMHSDHLLVSIWIVIIDIERGK